MANETLPDRTSSSWTVALLGGFEVRRDGHQIGLPPGTTRLVAFLALQPRFVTRAFLAGSLWIDDTQDRAFANLRSALWRLRRHADSLIVADSFTVGLTPSVSIDLVMAAEKVDQLNQDGLSKEAFPAIDQLTLELLPGWSDDWVLIERERHRQRSLHVLESIAQSMTDSGRFGLAIDIALRAVQMDPLRESAHRVLIRIHLAEGNRSEALRHYKEYRELMEAELGITPSPLLLKSTAVSK